MRNWMKELGLTELSRSKMNKNIINSLTNKEDEEMEMLFKDD